MSEYKVIGVHNITGKEKLVDLASASPWKNDSFIIPANSSFNTIEIPLDDLHSVSYILTVWNDNESVTKSLDFKVVKVGTTLKKVVFNKTGSVINLVVTPMIVGSIMKVVISTNESYDLSVNIAYLVL